jgi:hypothetical protein
MFIVNSPDGFTIERFPRTYETMDEVNQALRNFVQRYEWQGYYSTAYREHIPLDQIAERCTVIDTDNSGEI